MSEKTIDTPLQCSNLHRIVRTNVSVNVNVNINASSPTKNSTPTDQQQRKPVRQAVVLSRQRGTTRTKAQHRWRN